MTAIVISDGNPGHENRSLAIARALDSPDPPRIRLGPRMRRLGEELRALAALLEAPSPPAAERAIELLLQHTEATEAQLESLAEAGRNVWAISTGTPACVFALLLSAATGARTIVGGLRPEGRLYRHFDLCVCPAYHLPPGLPRKNVVATLLPPAYHDGRRSTAEAPEWLLALGGPAPEHPWSEAFLRSQFDALIDAAAKDRRRLRVTTSQRTPPSLLDWLSRRCAESSVLELAGPERRFADMLQEAQRVLITEDSESMLAEAINAGHCPGVLAVSKDQARLSDRAMEILEDLGLHTRPLDVRFAVRLAQRRGLARRLPSRQAVLDFCRSPLDRFPRNWLFEKLRQDLRRQVSQVAKAASASK